MFTMCVRLSNWERNIGNHFLQENMLKHVTRSWGGNVRQIVRGSLQPLHKTQCALTILARLSPIIIQVL